METLFNMDRSAMLFIVCILSSLCVISSALFLLIYFNSRRSVNALRKELYALAEKVRSMETSGEAAVRQFEQRLDPVQLKARFEKFETDRADVSEKYSHVARLERSGLGRDEIAEIFDVSEFEAEQMLSLARTSGA